MNAEFFEALKLLEAEKGISVEYLCEKIENAIVIAVRKDYAGIDRMVFALKEKEGEDKYADLLLEVTKEL